MPEAVSDSSPLISLAVLGCLDLLREWYTNVVIPPAVWNEEEWNKLCSSCCPASRSRPRRLPPPALGRTTSSQRGWEAQRRGTDAGP